MKTTSIGKRGQPFDSVCADWAMCKTPLCTKAAFHLGSCIDVVGKRHRSCVTVPVLEKHLNKYDLNLPKQAHRQYLLSTIQDTPDDSRPVLYLEGEEAGCTRFLLANGVAPGRLMPCNMKKSTAHYIQNSTGVKCVKNNIISEAENAPPAKFLTIWFDMTGTDMPLSRVVHAASHIMLTVNTRGCVAHAAERHLITVVKAIPGAKIQMYGAYRGTGKKLNMVYIFFDQKEPSYASSAYTEDSDAATSNVKSVQMVSPQMMEIGESAIDWLHVPLRIPLSRWLDAGLAFDHSMYRVSAGAVHATVADVDEGTLVLKYQTTGGHMMLDQKTFEKMMPPVTPTLAREWML